MLWKKKNKAEKKVDKKKEMELFLEDMDLTDEEFFLAEEIDGYSYCEGLNSERCNSECFQTIMMPTVTVLS